MKINLTIIILSLIIIYSGAVIGFYLNTFQFKRLEYVRKSSILIPLVTFIIFFMMLFNIADKFSKLSIADRIIALFIPHKMILIGMVLAYSIQEVKVDFRSTSYLEVPSYTTSVKYPNGLVEGVFGVFSALSKT